MSVVFDQFCKAAAGNANVTTVVFQTPEGAFPTSEHLVPFDSESISKRCQQIRDRVLHFAEKFQKSPPPIVCHAQALNEKGTTLIQRNYVIYFP
jgi:hypothetical protein